jgi:hypothetical protein
MGAKVGKFVADVAKTVAKAGTSYVLGKIPIVGSAAADYINKQYKMGGMVMKGMADGGVVSDKPKMVINTPAQLIALVKKVPEIAAKYDLTPELIRAEVAKNKAGEMTVAKKRGGKTKKGMKGGDSVMVHSGGGGEGVGTFARGGKVLSVF